MDKVIISEKLFGDFRHHFSNFRVIPYDFPEKDLDFYKPKILILDEKDYANRKNNYPNTYEINESTKYFTLPKPDNSIKIFSDILFFGKTDYRTISLIANSGLNFKIFGPLEYNVPQYIGMLRESELSNAINQSKLVLVEDNCVEKDLLNIIQCNGIPISFKKDYLLTSGGHIINYVDSVQDIKNLISNRKLLLERIEKFKKSINFDELWIGNYVKQMLGSI